MRRWTLITDRSCIAIAASMAVELDKLGCHWNGFVLEELAPRPLAGMPEPVLEDMESSQVSIFAVEVQKNELLSRMQMTDVVNRRRMRHAHMVNITPEIMTQGMRADFNAVDRLSQAVLDKVRQATYIRATTPAGTDIHAQLNPEYRWFKTSGIISQEKWGNLPGGECFTAPGEVNGVFVVDGVVGDFLCKEYGLLSDQPLRIDIEGNRIVRATSPNKKLEQDFWNYTHTDENSDRVGEFAIGTKHRGRSCDWKTSCRMRNSRACTSHSAIPTARIPVRSGSRRRISMLWVCASISGWAMRRVKNRSCATANS